MPQHMSHLTPGVILIGGHFQCGFTSALLREIHLREVKLNISLWNLAYNKSGPAHARPSVGAVPNVNNGRNGGRYAYRLLHELQYVVHDASQTHLCTFIGHVW